MTMVKKGTTMSECIYCGATLERDDPPPATYDDTGWSDVAREHRGHCEWAITRAHRLDDLEIVRLAAEADAALFVDEFPGEELDPTATDWDATAWSMTSLPDGVDRNALWPVYQKTLINAIHKTMEDTMGKTIEIPTVICHCGDEYDPTDAAQDREHESHGDWLLVADPSTEMTARGCEIAEAWLTDHEGKSRAIIVRMPAPGASAPGIYQHVRGAWQYVGGAHAPEAITDLINRAWEHAIRSGR